MILKYTHCFDRENIFKNSFKIHEGRAKTFQDSDLFPVCNLRSKFHLDDVNMVISIQTIV